MTRASSGGPFQYLGAETGKSLEACRPCTLGDGGISQAVLEDWRKRGAVRSVVSAGF